MNRPRRCRRSSGGWSSVRQRTRPPTAFEWNVIEVAARMQFHWPHASSPPGLDADEAHVWAISLDAMESVLHSFKATLSADERARAQAFRTEQLRRRFVAAHGSLRVILGHYLNE